MKLSDFGLCKPVDVSKLPTLHEEDALSTSRSGAPIRAAPVLKLGRGQRPWCAREGPAPLVGAKWSTPIEVRWSQEQGLGS